jgi:hypothetical protein
LNVTDDTITVDRIGRGAYVSGFASSQRVVLSGSIVAKEPHPEIDYDFLARAGPLRDKAPHERDRLCTAGAAGWETASEFAVHYHVRTIRTGLSHNPHSHNREHSRARP